MEKLHFYIRACVKPVTHLHRTQARIASTAQSSSCRANICSVDKEMLSLSWKEVLLYYAKENLRWTYVWPHDCSLHSEALFSYGQFWYYPSVFCYASQVTPCFGISSAKICTHLPSACYTFCSLILLDLIIINSARSVQIMKHLIILLSPFPFYFPSLTFMTLPDV